jgi:putative transposase
MVNGHNGWVPRDWWLLDWEKQAIIDYHNQYPLEGYRRLTFMVLNAHVVAVSPSSVYRVLRNAWWIQRHNMKNRSRARGSISPLNRTSTGMSILPTSTSVGHSSSSAAYSTAAAG